MFLGPRGAGGRCAREDEAIGGRIVLSFQPSCFESMIGTRASAMEKQEKRSCCLISRRVMATVRISLG